MRAVFGLGLPLIAAGACSFGADKEAAEAAASRLHEMIGAGRYHDVYATTSDEFRRITTEADFTRILQVIHDRLGPVRQADERGWRVNLAPGGNVVVLNYATRFASGQGTEEFVFRVSGTIARLAGYHVSSMNLLATGGSAPTQNSATSDPAPPKPANSGGK
jgi:hypothetical protein